METPHSLDASIEYSPSASSPCPFKEPGFLGNLDVPSLARGYTYAYGCIIVLSNVLGIKVTLGMLPVVIFELLILDVK